MSKLTGRTSHALLGGVGVALLLSGCGNAAPTQGAGAVSAHTRHQSTVHASTAPASDRSSNGGSSGGSNASSGTSSSPAAPGQCLTGQLDASLGAGDGAAGSTYYQLVLTNTGAQPCRTGGFGGVSFVGGGNGTQIGAAAVRVQKRRARSFVLQPGDRATATLQESEAGNYDASTCHPTPADGVRVYPPNNTESLFVKQDGAVGCKNPKARLLFLQPYRPAR